jgi:hypothetical protein
MNMNGVTVLKIGLGAMNYATALFRT